MGSNQPPPRPKSRKTDAGLRLRVIRGPRARGETWEWYWTALPPGGKPAAWSGWATEQAAGAIADGAWARLPAGDVLTVRDLLLRYVAAREEDHARGRSHADYLGQSTLDSYRRCALRMAEVVGDVPAGDLQADELAESVAILLEHGFSPRSVDQTVKVWRLAWRWARENTDHPLPDLPAPKVKIEGYTNNHRTPTDDEVRALLEALSGLERLAVELLAETGARLAEVSQLRCEDVHPRSGSLTFRGKTGARSVEPAPELLARVAALLHDDPDDRRVFRFPDRRSGRGFVKFGKQRIDKAIQDGCAVAGVEPFTAHGLRRAVVRRFIREGVDVKTAADVLGHSVIVMLKIYAEVTDEDRRRALERIALGVEAEPPRAAQGGGKVIVGPWGR